MIRFQTATIHDAPKINQLVNSAYRGDHAKKGWTTEADLLEGSRTDEASIRQDLEDPLTQIELLFEGKSLQLSGCIQLTQELPDTLYFGMLTVEPTLQGHGLGKILLNRAEGIARSLGLKKIRCHVIPVRTELVDFYKRRGYKETESFKDFPKDEKNGIPKVNDLRLQELVKELEPLYKNSSV